MKFDYKQEPGKVLIQQEQHTDIDPLVTIITPFYNSGKHFTQTYNCVINQTFPWFEWIIVNDGSTNQEDINLLLTLKNRDSRITLLEKENGGIASARNMAIRYSRTDFIVPLDADDLISATYIEINYWALVHNPNAAWSYTDSVGFGTQEYLWKKSFSSEIMKVNNLLTCTAMIRKSAFEQVGLYSELDKHFNEDWYSWLKLLAKQYYPLHLSGYYFWYRRNDSGVLSQVNNNKAVKKKSIKAIKKIAREVTEKVEAIEFPRASGTENFLPPSFSNVKVHIRNKCNKASNLLMIIPWLEMGGADSFNLSFALYGKKTNFDIGIITTNYSENTWKQRFERDIPEIFELPNFMEINDYAEFISYYIITRNVTTVFLSNSYIGYYLIPWLKKEFPMLVIVDYVHMEEWYWRNGGYARTSGVFGPFLNKTFVCNSKTKKVLIDSFNRNSDSIDVSYIGVDYHYFNRDVISPDKIKEKLNLNGKKIILFPCRLEPQKRPLLMVHIASELKKYRSDFAFIVVGDGPMMEELKTKTKQLSLSDYIFFEGRQSDLRPYYRDSSLTLICSLKEGLALTAYESCSMGVPVISSDVGGQSELIDSSVGAIIPIFQEETDYDSDVIKTEEIQQYVTNILRIISDESYQKMLSENCQTRIQKNFYINDMLEQLYEKIRKLECTPINSCSSELAQEYDFLINDFVILYTEFENRINFYNYGIDRFAKRELMRIMNSNLGQRLIKIAFSLKLNRIFK